MFSNDSVYREYSFDNVNWNPYNETGVVVDENKTVYFRAQDAVGNVSDVAGFEVNWIDKTASDAPVVSADTDKPTNQDVTVTAVFNEDAVTRQYSYDKTNWNDYTESLVLSENKTVYFRSIDGNGKTSLIAKYDVTNIDKVPPVKPTASANITDPTNKNVTVSASFSNDTATKQYSLDNETWKTYTSGVVMSENGTVYFRGIDAAGNVSETASYVVSNIDHSLPDPTPEPTPEPTPAPVGPAAPKVSADITAATTKDVTVSATFGKDATIMQYSLDGKTWLAYTEGIVMKDNGTVYFRAGNDDGWSDALNFLYDPANVGNVISWEFPLGLGFYQRQTTRVPLGNQSTKENS